MTVRNKTGAEPAETLEPPLPAAVLTATGLSEDSIPGANGALPGLRVAVPPPGLPINYTMP